MAATESGHDGTAPYRSLKRPKPMTSLVAAAKRITSRNIRETGKVTAQDWQADAWDMYDLVGEQHFLATTLANRVGQARLYAGRLPEDPTDPPEPIDDGPVAEAFAAFSATNGATSQLIARLAVNLFIAGDGWLVGIPRQLLPKTTRDLNTDDPEDPDRQWVQPVEPLLALSDLEWRMLSVSEVRFDQSVVTLHLGESKEEKLAVNPDEIFMVRVWRSHPRRWWQADSPTRASLPVLRELVGLTEHVSAQVDSRLAGAGVFVVPSSARDAFLQRAGTPEDDEDDADPFTEALMEAMITPIKDRSNASAFVPLVVTVPDDVADKFQHISFASQLDAESRNLRDEAIRRLALGQDAPPEILLGVGGMNHWGAWLVREDTITTHIEPPLALICDALTTQFLRPVLLDQGMSPEQAEQYVVWYDVDHMIMRPNRLADASLLHAAGALSDEAFRDAGGFSEADAPVVAQDLDLAVKTALDMVANAPSLAQNPGIPALVDQLRFVIEGTPLPEPATTTTTAEPVGDESAGPPPDQADEGGPQADPEEIPAAAAIADERLVEVDGELMSPRQFADKFIGDANRREHYERARVAVTGR